MMKLSQWLVVTVALSTLICSAEGRADETDELAARGVILRTQEVREGMRGVCKTVFHGTTIESFDVELLGVLEGANAGGDMILFRVLNGPVVERKTGILAGMSGSPVYVEGRLVGAVAYTWSGALEPVGGISPIEEMLESLEPPGDGKPSTGQTAELPSPMSLAGRLFTKVCVQGIEPVSPPVAAPDTLVLRPIATPILVNGFRSRSLPELAKILQPYGLEPMQGAGSRKSGVAGPVEPGAAIGIDLVSGDLSMTTVGTLTYRDGDRVLAFGHPFLGTGRGLVPLATAYVHAILPNRSMSVKMASTLDTIGAITQDWVAGVGGVLGRKAPMIPVRIITRDPARGRERVFNFSVVDHKELTASLTISAALDACYAGFADQTEGTMRLEMRAEAKGLKPIVRRNVFYTRGAVGSYGIFELADAVVNLTDNPYERAELTRLELVAELDRKNTAAEIQRVTVAPNKVEPGDDLTVSVILEPKTGKPETYTTTFTVPKDTPGGSLRVGVGSGANELYFRQRLGLYLPRTNSLKDILDLWGQIGSNSELRVVASLPNMGAAVADQQLRSLPSSVLNVMRTTRTTGVLFPLQGLRKSFETDWDIVGRVHLVTVQVAGKRGAVSAPRPPSPPPSPKPPEGAPGARPTSTSWLAGGHVRRSRLLEQLEAVSPWGAVSEPAPVQVGSPTQQPAQPAAPPPSATRPPSTTRSSKPPAKPPTKKREGIGRPTSTWRSAGLSGFLNGEHDGTCVTTAGDLRLAPRARKLLAPNDLYVWSLAAAPDGSAYAGIGNGGRIYRIAAEGDATAFAETGAAGVYALAVSEAGALVAGLSPGARLVTFDANGKQTVLCDLDEDYIWHLQWESKDTLLVATGPRGRIYRLKLGGQPELAYDLPQRHVRRLARGSSGTIYASTGDPEVLCELGDKGTYKTLYESSDGEILGLAAGDEGALYFSAARKGNVYEWEPDGGVELFFESSQRGSFDLVRDDTGNLYLATTGRTAKGIVYKIDPEGAGMRVLEPEQSHALCLALTTRQTLLVGLGNSAALYELALQGNLRATYESEVHDAKSRSRWGTATWEANTPEGSSVAIEVRSGNTDEPDDTWSDWRQLQGGATATRVPCPASRYLQFRVELQAEAGKGEPQLQSVEVVYLPANKAPKVALKEPTGGARLSGKKKIVWTGSDPDGDPLKYSLYTSADGGETWKAVKLADPKKNTHELDTSKFDDGVYRLKVEASDDDANPGDGRTAEALGEPVVIDNKAPFVVMGKDVKRGEGDSVVFRATAVDRLSRVTGAEYRIDKGAWKATRAVNGLFDASAEEIEFEAAGLSGKHAVELRVRDEAGNLTTKKRGYDLPKKESPKAEAKKEH